MQGADIAIGAQIARSVADDVAGGVDAGEGLVGDADIGVLLVISEQNVIAGFMGFDLGCFEDQGLLFGAGDDIVEIGDIADQSFELAAAVAVVCAKIRADAMAQIFGFADVDDLPVASLHKIHAGIGRQGVELEAAVFGQRLLHLSRLEG